MLGALRVLASYRTCQVMCWATTTGPERGHRIWVKQACGPFCRRFELRRYGSIDLDSMGQSDSLAINHNWVSTQTSSNFTPPSRSPVFSVRTKRRRVVAHTTHGNCWPWRRTLLKAPGCSNGSHRKFHNHIFTCFQMLSRTLVTFLKKKVEL
jgi:hypothetical protein